MKFLETSNRAIFLGERERWIDGWLDCSLDGWKDGRFKKANIKKTGFFTGFSETSVTLFGLFSCHEKTPLFLNMFNFIEILFML